MERLFLKHCLLWQVASLPISFSSALLFFIWRSWDIFFSPLPRAGYVHLWGPTAWSPRGTMITAAIYIYIYVLWALGNWGSSRKQTWYLSVLFLLLQRSNSFVQEQSRHDHPPVALTGRKELAKLPRLASNISLPQQRDSISLTLLLLLELLDHPLQEKQQREEL